MTHDRVSNERFPLEAKLAAVRAYVKINGTCRPEAMEAALWAVFKHLRSPAAVSDAMVERAYEAWDAYKPSQTDASGYGAMRAALTASLAPAEQEGENAKHQDEHADRDAKLWLDLAELRAIRAPTHPGGDSREPVGIVVCVDGVTDVSWYEGPDLAPGTELVPLSSLEAVERERDAARQAVDAFADICDELGVERDNEAGLIAVAELKASLAAAREALTNIRELNLTGEDENGHRWANSDLIDQEILAAHAALAGSNGE